MSTKLFKPSLRMGMPQDEDQSVLAVKVARLYYYQGLTTNVIADELGLSRPKVSRLLTFARQSGLVEIRINDPVEGAQALEKAIQQRFGVAKVRVVPVPQEADESEWLQRVAQYTAGHLNSIIRSKMILGIAWGTTVDAISQVLMPKRCYDVEIVQLNGSGNVYTINNFYTSEIYSRFAQNYGGRAFLFPVPAFFDYAETKQALWRESSIRRLVEMTNRADLLIYSIGSARGRVPSYVYSEGYLSAEDFEELEREGVVGDIATVFFRQDGSYQDIPLNTRATGPNLSLFQQSRHGLCVVSGLGKVEGLRAALMGRMMSELILDEFTARALLDTHHNGASG